MRFFWSILAAALSLTACFYVLTHGKWEVSAKGFNTYYDEQAKSLLEGRWDVPPSAISGEAFIVNGKLYGYFPFAPALPRMALNAVWPSMFGKWSRISMATAIASLAVVFFLFAHLMKIPAAVEPILIAILLCGSTVLFLCESDYLYHEAILWAATLSIWAYYWFGRYLLTYRFRYLLLGAACAFGAFFSRFSSGAGPLLCALWIAAILWKKSRRWKTAPPLEVKKVEEQEPPRVVVKQTVRMRSASQIRQMRNAGRVKSQAKKKAEPKPSPVSSVVDLEPRRRPVLERPLLTHAAFLVLFLGLTGITFVEENRMKFGTFLEAVPVRYSFQYNAERLKKIRGTLVHPEYFLAIAGNYLDPHHIKFVHRPPYLGFTAHNDFHGVPFDLIEPYASLPAALPALFLLTVAGLWFLFRQAPWRYAWCLPLAVGALAGGSTLFLINVITYRYEHDCYPLFFLGALLGAVWIGRLSAGPKRWGAYAALLLTGVWSIAANAGFVIELSRNPGLFQWH